MFGDIHHPLSGSYAQGPGDPGGVVPGTPKIFTPGHTCNVLIQWNLTIFQKKILDQLILSYGIATGIDGYTKDKKVRLSLSLQF